MAYSMKTQAGKWTHVPAPTKGQINAVGATFIDKEASPYIKGCILVGDEVKSDFGHTDYPTPSDTQSNELLGTVMKMGSYNLLSGVTYSIALTINNVYYYNATTETWDCITQGLLIDDCEAAWDAGTGVASNANDDVWLRGQVSSMNTILEFAPVAHFPMNDDAADTDVEDTAGDNTGTASANTDTLSVAAIVGDGFDLEFASSNYVTIGGAMAAQFTDTVGSIHSWVNVESLTAERIICGGSDASGTSMIVLSITTTGAVRAYLHNGTAMQWDVQTADDCIEVATDYHIVLVQDGVTPKIYLDTEDEGLVTNTSTDTTAWFADVADVDTALIGAVSTGGTGAEGFFDGILDEWRYYEVAITAREVTGLYNNGEGTGEVSGFTTGVISSEDDVTTADISAATNTYLLFWIRADKAIAADVLRLRLSEQAAGGTGATYADYTVPALVANVWQHCSVDTSDPVADDGGTYPTDLNAVASVSLVAQSDPGPSIIYIDDIRTATQFTGDEDDQWSVENMNDTFIFTNGIDQPQKITESGGVLTNADLTTTLAAGSITTSDVVVSLMDHLLLFNNTENAANAPQRGSWTNIGAIEDFIVGTAGYQDLVDDDSAVVTVKKIDRSSALIYKERAVVKCEWVGGQTPFRFETILFGTGCEAKDGVAEVDGTHYVFGKSSIYRTNGSTNIKEDADAKLSAHIYALLDMTYSNRAFMLYIPEDEEVQLWVATNTAYPDTVWCMSTKTGVWYRKARTMNGGGFYTQQSAITIGSLVGTIGEQDYLIGDTLVKQDSPITLVGDTNGKVYKLDKLVLNNDGVAITNDFQTPDFIAPGTGEYQSNFIRVPQLVYEAKGQSVTTHWSDDSGLTWYPTQGGGTHVQTLTTDYAYYTQDFDATPRKIRFRWRNDTVSSGYQLRYYGFYWILRSGRR